MKNNNLIILAILGIGGYLAYTQYKKSQGASIPGYTPTPSGGGSGSGEKKKLSFDEVLKLINATLDTFSNIQLTYNQKVTAVKDIEKLINAGKSQQEIEIEMGNKYKLTPTQVRSIVNKLYA
jgi:hypothetical protein